MLSLFTLFAGEICLNPHTERDSFIWGLAIGIFLLVLLSILLGMSALVIKVRHTINPRRKQWVKRYRLSSLVFLLFMGLGWVLGTGGTTNDYCKTAKSSIQGNALLFLAVIAGLAALISLFGFIFSFTPKTSKR
jgi:cytochrome bd-type quinol oxidase subunit 2